MIKSRFVGIIRMEQSPDEVWGLLPGVRWHSSQMLRQEFVAADMEQLVNELQDAYQELATELPASRGSS